LPIAVFDAVPEVLSVANGKPQNPAAMVRCGKICDRPVDEFYGRQKRRNKQMPNKVKIGNRLVG